MNVHAIVNAEYTVTFGRDQSGDVPDPAEEWYVYDGRRVLGYDLVLADDDRYTTLWDSAIGVTATGDEPAHRITLSASVLESLCVCR